MGEIIRLDPKNFLSVLHNSEGLKEIGKPFSQQIYLLDLHIAGTTHVGNIKELEPAITLEKRLVFVREPKNEHDPLAIQVRDENGNRLGFIPRDQNEILARLMDAGKHIYGTVKSKEYVGNWLKITMQVYLDD